MKVANFGKCRTAVFLASALAILATVSVCVGGGYGADLAWMNVTTVGGGVPAGTPATEYTAYITTNTTDFNGIDYETSTVYTGIVDTRISAGSPTSNYGDGSGIQVAKYEAGGHQHSLIAFTGLSNIPGTATIKSVTLGFYVHDSAAGTRTIKLTRVLRNWVEAEATWNIYSTGNNWTTAGCLSDGNDRAASASNAGQSLGTGGSARWVTVTVTSGGILGDVKNWVDGTYSNYGWHIERDDGANDSTYDAIWSTEGDTNGLKPYLKVVYEN